MTYYDDAEPYMTSMLNCWIDPACDSCGLSREAPRTDDEAVMCAECGAEVGPACPACGDPVPDGGNVGGVCRICSGYADQAETLREMMRERRQSTNT